MGQSRYEQAEEYVHRCRLDKIGTHDPSVFLDLHPAGDLAALQGYVNSTVQAAVFDLISGHILWQPEVESSQEFDDAGLRVCRKLSETTAILVEPTLEVPHRFGIHTARCSDIRYFNRDCLRAGFC